MEGQILIRFCSELKNSICGRKPKNIRTSNTELEFTRPEEKKTKPILMETEVREFLDSVLADNTRKNYTRALEVFEEYTGRTAPPTHIEKSL